MAALPLLPTVGVGSYAAPGWFVAGQRAARADGWGAHDVAELEQDATLVAVADQRAAGVDILTSGELTRQRFVFDSLGAFDGLRRVPATRRLGITGYDRAPHFERIAPLTAARGLGIVDEFTLLRRIAGSDLPLKVALPGALTFASFIDAPADAGAALVDELTALVRREVMALAEAGADYIQIDEPGLPCPPHGLSLEDAAAVVNRTLADAPARRAVHVCFGNNAGRPFADRRMPRLMPALEALACEELVLEFANREMADVGLLAPLGTRFDIAAGVIDVKNFYLETPDMVADRITQCLAFVAPEKLRVTADCGFSALPRYLARQKMEAMVEGARLVRMKNSK